MAVDIVEVGGSIAVDGGGSGGVGSGGEESSGGAHGVVFPVEFACWALGDVGGVGGGLGSRAGGRDAVVGCVGGSSGWTGSGAFVSEDEFGVGGGAF